MPLILVLASALLPGAAAAATETAPAEVGAIDTVAGTGRGELGPARGPALEVNLNQPFGLEFGPDGALYICEIGNHRVLRLDSKTRELVVVAGNGKKGHSGDGGPATAASLNEPYEVRFDAAGDMYFVEMVGALVRKVDHASGRIETVAGTGEPGFGGDGGPAIKARFSSPHSIALDGGGGLYVADIGNHRVRRVDLKSGAIDTVAGDGRAEMPEDGALARGAPLKGPRALAVHAGGLWIGLREGNSIWRLDLASGKLARIAGTGAAGWRDGPAKEAVFDGPKGIAFGPAGDLFIADTENHAIRRLDLKSGSVTTVAGTGPKGQGYAGDGGPALAAKLDRPHGIAVDASGAVYIGDSSNNRVRRVEPAAGAPSKR